MNHDEVYMPLCMNILFSYAVLLFNSVYEIFLGILPFFSKMPVSVLIPFRGPFLESPEPFRAHFG